MPGMLIATKLIGLKKLRNITRSLGRQGHAGITYLPFKVYAGSSQFRIAHLRGMPRALIRTDPKKQSWQTYAQWEAMARGEVGSIRGKGSLTRQQVKKAIDENLERRVPGAIPLRAIVHPVRRRYDLKYYGEIRYSPEKRCATFRFLELEDHDTWKLRDRYPSVVIHLRESEGRFVRRVGGVNPRIDVNANPPLAEILRKVKIFLKAAKREGKQGFEASFVTYNDAPTDIEFYDFLQDKPEQEKKKK